MENPVNPVQANPAPKPYPPGDYTDENGSEITILAVREREVDYIRAGGDQLTQSRYVFELYAKRFHLKPITK